MQNVCEMEKQISKYIVPNPTHLNGCFLQTFFPNDLGKIDPFSGSTVTLSFISDILLRFQ